MPVIRDLAWRYIAGETLADGVAVIRTLNSSGIKGSLNYVGVHVRDAAEAVAAADQAIASLEAIASSGVDSHVSVKLTQIGLDVDETLCREQIQKILACAMRLGIFVRIDMEEAQYVDQTLRIFDDCKARFGGDAVGVAIQSYLRHRDEDLETLVESGARVRLVKGGYWEPEEVVHRKKDEIDAAFLRGARLLLQRGRSPAIASHDENVIAAVKGAAADLGRDKADFEFQMLYGVRSDLQTRLRTEGYNVRCYVPYGGQWHTYFLGCLRRAVMNLPKSLLERGSAT